MTPIYRRVSLMGCSPFPFIKLHCLLTSRIKRDPFLFSPLYSSPFKKRNNFRQHFSKQVLGKCIDLPPLPFKNIKHTGLIAPYEACGLYTLNFYGVTDASCKITAVGNWQNDGKSGRSIESRG